MLVNNEPVMTAIGSTTAKSGSARLVVVPRHSAVSNADGIRFEGALGHVVFRLSGAG